MTEETLRKQELFLRLEISSMERRIIDARNTIEHCTNHSNWCREQLGIVMKELGGPHQCLM